MKSHAFAVLVVVALVMTIVFPSGLTDQPHKSFAQGADKTLDIERHANEPLELVDIKVNQQSLKNKIRVKSRKGDVEWEGFDRLEYQGEDGWLKHLRIKMRNVSGRSISGSQAYLYLRPPGSQMLFSVTLTGPTSLQSTALQKLEEIELRVDDGSWDRMLNNLKQYGFNVNSAEVRLSVENVAFSDGLLWDGGQYLRSDPERPQRWIPDRPKRPPGGRLHHSTGWRVADVGLLTGSLGKGNLATLTSRPLQAGARCKVDSGYDAWSCSSYGCWTIIRLGGEPGLKSAVAVQGDCRTLPGPVQP